MGMNETPSADRVHIGIFGRRNAGKSSLINAVTGQDLAIVSDIKGTTTDPVSKAMELLPLGPVVLIDTPGLDDEGELGEKRRSKGIQALNRSDMAILVIDGSQKAAGLWHGQIEERLQKELAERKVPYVIAVNKAENLTEGEQEEITAFLGEDKKVLFVSALSGLNIHELKECIAGLVPKETPGRRLIGDLLAEEDIAVLVVPIDSGAPKGRLILPQQQVIRDCLESGAIPLVVRETELPAVFRLLAKKPKVVITDSQMFGRVSKDTPNEIYLTSFSILFSRYKGNLKWQAAGAEAVRKLNDGDRVLISEGCTHHRQCGDIGTVKLPCWIEEFTGKKLHFTFTSGGQFPEDLSEYSLIVHCGGCMLNDREMKYRIRCAKEQGVPITNYGTMIACIHGVLDRSLKIFQENPQEGL